LSGNGLLTYGIEHVDYFREPKQHDATQKPRKERSKAKRPTDLILDVK
jgi:hypothetical protein